MTPDYLICLEDGIKLKMLKRHLRTAYDMTPEQYRERWGLPPITRWWRPITPRSARRWRANSASARAGASVRPGRRG